MSSPVERLETVCAEYETRARAMALPLNHVRPETAAYRKIIAEYREALTEPNWGYNTPSDDPTEGLSMTIEYLADALNPEVPDAN